MVQEKILKKRSKLGYLQSLVQDLGLACWLQTSVQDSEERADTPSTTFPNQRSPKISQQKRSGFLESGSGIATFFSHKGNH